MNVTPTDSYSVTKTAEKKNEQHVEFTQHQTQVQTKCIDGEGTYLFQNQHMALCADVYKRDPTGRATAYTTQNPKQPHSHSIIISSCSRHSYYYVEPHHYTQHPCYPVVRVLTSAHPKHTHGRIVVRFRDESSSAHVLLGWRV